MSVGYVYCSGCTKVYSLAEQRIAPSIYNMRDIQIARLVCVADPECWEILTPCGSQQLNLPFWES